MRKFRSVFLLLALVLIAASAWLAQESTQEGQPASTTVSTPAGLPQAEVHAGLPPEALQTLQLIESGGPYPYDRDGTVFQNRERRLPAQPRGYYREYTVRTPGSRDRGARRIVSGGDPPTEFFYTDDHYDSFRRIEATPP